MKRALIPGVSGQDGAYMAKLLLKKGYEVFGTSRNPDDTSFYRLEKLNIRNRIHIQPMSVADIDAVRRVIEKVEPDEIYNLAGQSSVSVSFQRPVETLESITGGTLNMLEAIRLIGKPIKYFNPGSSECFGDTQGQAADETTPFQPNSPYADAKAKAFGYVTNFRETHHIFACSSIMFNHESPLRSDQFVSRKIISTACRISAGSNEKLRLGNLQISRDWGWAPDFVEAMWKMLQQDTAQDFVLATGESRKLEEFVALTFSYLGMNWQDHVESDPKLMRTSDVLIAGGNPTKAERLLKWVAVHKMEDIIHSLIDAEKQDPK